MPKDQYIELIKSKISSLTIEQQNAELAFLNALSDEQMSTLPNAEEMAQQILQKYAVKKEKRTLKPYFQNLIKTVQTLFEIMRKSDVKSNLKIIWDLFILIVFVSLLKIPFILVRNIVETLVQPLDIPIVVTISYAIVELIYLVVAILVFIRIFKRWFKNLPNEVKEKPKKPEKIKIGEDLTSISLTDKKDDEPKS